MTIDLNTTNPLTFLEWKGYYEDISDASELSIKYNNYLIEWKDQKQINTNADNDYTRKIYVQFLENLNLSSLDSNVAAFIERIDTDDIYELELSVFYFVEVIQNQLKNVRELREEVKFATPKNKLKTSRLGIEKYIKNYISRLLNNNEFIKEGTDTLIHEINLPKIANNIKIGLKNYVTDNFIYDIHSVDKDLVLNLARKVWNESYHKKGDPQKIIQLLSINKDGKQLQVRTNCISTPDSMISINDTYTDYKRLPGRYFRGEEKT